MQWEDEQEVVKRSPNIVVALEWEQKEEEVTEMKKSFKAQFNAKQLFYNDLINAITVEIPQLESDINELNK